MPIDLEAAYANYGRRIIPEAIQAFRRRWGGDLDDLLSHAQELFVNACLSWDPTRGPLDKRLWHCIWWGLFETIRQEASRNHRLHRVPLDQTSLEEVPCQEQTNLWDQLRETGTDPFIVAQLAVAVKDRLIESKRKNVFETLADLDWSQERTNQAVNLVKEALR